MVVADRGAADGAQPNQHDNRGSAALPKVLGFSSPDAGLLLQIEGQQMERNQNQQEKAALAKLERIKLDQGKRAEDLERDAAEAESKVSSVAFCTLQLTQP